LGLPLENVVNGVPADLKVVDKPHGTDNITALSRPAS